MFLAYVSDVRLWCAEDVMYVCDMMYVCDVCFWRMWGVMYVSESQKGCTLIRCLIGLHSHTLPLIDVWGRETESMRDLQ